MTGTPYTIVQAKSLKNKINELNLEDITMNNKNYTLEGSEIGLQVSKMGNIPAGEFYLQQPFYIKNNTMEIIPAEVMLVGSNEYIPTSIFPGWNVEICKKVKTTSTNLQYGR